MGMAPHGRRDSGAILRLRGAREDLSRRLKAVPLAERSTRGLEHGLLSAASAIMAYVPTQLLGLREGFWAAITALAVAQTEFGATRSTARDQFTGAAIGGIIGLCVSLVLPSGLPSYGLAVVASLTAAWLLNVASAGRLAGITATIILLVPHVGTPERMMASRLFEVGWGVSVAVAIVWASKGIFGRTP